MTKRFGMSRKDYFCFALKLLSLLFLILLVSGAGCRQIVPPNFREGIEVITEERNRAENWGSRLKSDYAKDTTEYRRGEALYIEAKSAFDGWIEQIEFVLRAGIDFEKSDQYQESLNQAAGKNQIFINYVEFVTTPETKSTAPPVLNALIEGFIKIWEEYRIAKRERRKEIIEALDQLKWKSFDEIIKGR